MAEQPPPPSTVILPPELHREIIQHFHPCDDIHTLRNVCLVSTAWLVEGRRILYSRGPDTLLERPRISVVELMNSGRVYMAFLDTIIAKNLGGHIKEFKHYYLDTHELQKASAASALMRALPMMHNLKSLHIDLHDLEPSRLFQLSHIATFQLHTLSITAPSAGYSACLTEFLCHQLGLVHMSTEYRHDPTVQEAMGPFDGILPNLISLQTNDAAHVGIVALTHNIKAVHLVNYEHLSDKAVIALRTAKYLYFGCCSSALDALDGIPNITLTISPAIDLKIEVLRLYMQGDIHKTVYELAPRLRHLRILIAFEATLWKIKHAMPLLWFLRVAAIAFSRCSSLLYVIVPNYDGTKGAYLYRRSTLKAAGVGPVMEEHAFDWVWNHADPRSDWWVEWDNVLSGKSTLGLTHHAPLLMDMSDYYSSDGLFCS